MKKKEENIKQNFNFDELEEAFNNSPSVQQHIEKSKKIIQNISLESIYKLIKTSPPHTSQS